MHCAHDFSAHGAGAADTAGALLAALVAHKVIVLPGSYFSPAGAPSAFIRLSFSPADDAQVRARPPAADDQCTVSPETPGCTTLLKPRTHTV